MNHKAAAILAVVALVIASVGAVSLSDGVQAADSDEVYKQGNLLVTESGASRTYQVNEQQFAGYVYEMTWKVGVVTDTSGSTSPSDTESWTTIITSVHTTPGSQPVIKDEPDGASVGKTGSSFTVNMDDGDAVGKYVLSVTSTASAGTEVSVGLQCQIKVTIGGIEKTLAEVYYIFDLVKSDSVSTSMVLDPMNDLVVGKIFGEYVTETSGIIGDISDYYWYAVNLPEGLTMSEGGYVSGVPLESVDSKTANVVATHRTTGETFEGVLTLSVDPATQTMENYYFVVSINGQDQTAGLGTYAVVQGESVVLKTFSGTSPGGTAIDATDVKVVGEDGKVNDASEVSDESNGEYTIPTNGTGAYRVVITMGSGDDAQSAEFYLFVSPSLDNIQAGIIITGN